LLIAIIVLRTSTTVINLTDSPSQ